MGHKKRELSRMGDNKMKSLLIVGAGAVVNHDASICKCSQIDCNAVVAAGEVVSEKTKIQSCTVWNNN